jgi:ATP synthase protein I
LVRRACAAPAPPRRQLAAGAASDRALPAARVRVLPRRGRNVDWEGQLDAQAREAAAAKAKAAAGAGGAGGAGAPPTRGFLSLSRSMALDDMSVEMDSPVLQSADTPAEALSLAEGLAPLESAFVPATGAPRYAPTRGERKRWTGGSKFLTSSTAKEVDAAKEGEEERIAARAADLVRYDTLKAELFGFTAGLAGVTTVAVGALYTGEAAASYAVGAAGGLVYLRLLSRSVDSTSGGAKGVGDVVEGTLGSQRLLVPAVLVAGWNRWNALGAPVTGIELQIAPILAGFFTYKIATLVQLFRDLFPRRSDQSA